MRLQVVNIDVMVRPKVQIRQQPIDFAQASQAFLLRCIALAAPALDGNHFVVQLGQLCPHAPIEKRRNDAHQRQADGEDRQQGGERALDEVGESEREVLLQEGAA